MDRIDEVNGELEVIDYKTGNVLVGKQLSEDMQVPLYIYVIKNHFKKPVRKFTLYYLEENKERVFERKTDDIYVCTVGKKHYEVSLRETVKEVKKTLSNMQKGKFSIPSNFKAMYFKCKICPLKREGGCEGAEKESWKQMNPGSKFSW
jgi:RecB family exonuclease